MTGIETSTPRTAGRRAARTARRRRVLVLAAAGFVALALFGGLFLHRVAYPGFLFLSRVSDSDDRGHQSGVPFLERQIQIPFGERLIPARVYEPDDDFERVVVVVHGVHWGGYDESRLVPFARKLCGMGCAVVTPDIVSLRNYDIAPEAVDDIERTLLWTLDESGLVSEKDSDGKVGLVGISFSGGLGLSAAARPGLRDRMAFVLSFGGHGDLDRTMEYLVTGRLPDGGELPAHVYGQVVLLRQFAGRFLPQDQIGRFRELAFLYLKDEEGEVAKSLEGLPPESRRLLELALARDTKTLGELLAPCVRETRADPRLSPVRFDPPDCPVYLLHGTVDNVIPPSETRLMGEWASPRTPTHVLVSSLVVHVELEDGPSLGDYWDLAVFMTRVLRS